MRPVALNNLQKYCHELDPHHFNLNLSIPPFCNDVGHQGHLTWEVSGTWFHTPQDSAFRASMQLTDMSLLAACWVEQTQPQFQKDTSTISPTITPLASSSLPGSSDQSHTTERLLLGRILGNTSLTCYFWGGRSISASTPAFPGIYAGCLRDTRGAIIRWPSASIRFGVEVLLLLNAAIRTIVLTFLNYKSLPAGIYRGNL